MRDSKPCLVQSLKRPTTGTVRTDLLPNVAKLVRSERLRVLAALARFLFHGFFRPLVETDSHLRVVTESFVFPLLTLDLNPDCFDVAEMLWVERKWQEIGKIVAAFRLIVVADFR